MQTIHTKIIGYGLFIAGMISTPLFPFWGLLLVPLVLLWLRLPVSAVAFAMLLDAFLVPDAITPIWISLTWYTVLLLICGIYVRYTTTL